MKRYAGDDYYFVINRAKLQDRGEYIIRAENHYGAREEVVFLNVQRKPELKNNLTNNLLNYIFSQLFLKLYLNTNLKHQLFAEENPYLLLCGEKNKNVHPVLPFYSDLVLCKNEILVSYYVA